MTTARRQHARKAMSVSLPARAAEDVRQSRLHRRASELDPVAALDREAGLRDRRGGVASEMPARGELRPQGRAVGQLKQRALRLAAGDHVLVEAQLTAG